MHKLDARLEGRVDHLAGAGLSQELVRLVPEPRATMSSVGFRRRAFCTASGASGKFPKVTATYAPRATRACSSTIWELASPKTIGTPAARARSYMKGSLSITTNGRLRPRSVRARLEPDCP